MTGDRKPSKPWRVDEPADRNGGESYRSQAAAYGAVRELNRYGHPARVFQWEDGAWRLFEVIRAPEGEPASIDTESPLEADGREVRR
jgi:hypothetical protein